MRSIAPFIGLVAVALILGAPASALTVGGVEQDANIDGQSMEAGAPDTGADAPLDADATGGIQTSDASLGAKAPTCKLETDAGEFADSGCERGAVNAQTDAPELSYDVKVRFGMLEDAPAADESGELKVAESGAAVAQMPPMNVAIAAAAAASATGLAAYGITRALRTLGIAGLIPLYSHIRDEDLLNDPNRARIHKLIQQEPGISTKDIAGRLDLAWGTVTHHLTKLEKRRIVVSKKYGKYRRFFLNGAATAATKDVVAILSVPRTKEVAEFIRSHPGITQKEVGDRLGVSSSTILWHVKRLQKVDLVQKVRNGKTVQYYPGESLKTADVITPAHPSGATLA